MVPSSRPQQIIEWKIPLWGVVSAAGAFALFLIAVWVTGTNTQKEVKDLQDVVRDLKEEVKSGNKGMSKMDANQVLFQFRLETNESDIRALKNKGKP